jgi:hypothetical protein
MLIQKRLDTDVVIYKKEIKIGLENNEVILLQKRNTEHTCFGLNEQTEMLVL